MTLVLRAEQMVRISCCVGIAVLARRLSKIILLWGDTQAAMHIHANATRTFVHANSDIMHGCPLRFIIKALSGCTGCEGVNMNRIKQIV